MKRILFSLFFFSAMLLGLKTTKAALPNGANAANFTVSEIPADCDVANGWGPDFTLYDELSAGRHVVIDFSATWCGPCWSYHQGGTLESLYDDYGPDGDNSIRVVYIEMDCGTSVECLCGSTGCSGGTQGDWTAGTNYPIFSPSGSNCSQIDNDYNVTYFPTLYAISANNYKVYLVGQVGTSTWESWLFESFELEISSSVTDASCAGAGEIAMSHMAGYGNISYSWSNGATGATITGLDAGFYSVTATDSHGYAITMDNIEVTGGTNAPLVLSEDLVQNVSCYGAVDGIIEVSGSGGTGVYNYLWTTGSTDNSIYTLDPGDYGVTCTDTDGCSQELSFVITSPSEISNFIIVTDATCYDYNGSVSFNTNGGTMPYSYDIGDGPVTVSVISGLESGDYICTMTDGNGCVDVQSFLIEDIPPPSAATTTDGDLSCSNSSVMLSATGSSQGVDISYQWSTTDGNIVGDSDGFDVEVDAEGTYVLVVVDGASNCQTTADQSVVDNSIEVTAASSPSGILNCDNSTVTITGTTNITGGTYAWTTEDGNIVSGADSEELVVDAAGTYSLTVVDATTGCEGTSSSSVDASTDVPQLSIDDPETITCTVQTVMLSAVVDGNQSDFSFVWTTDDGTIVSGADEITVEVSSAGTYVLVTTHNTSNCSVTTTVSVDAITVAPEASLAVQNGADESTFDFTGDATLETEAWFWDFGDGSNSNEQSPSHTFAEDGTYNVCLTVSNDCGTDETCQEITVGILIPFEVSFVASDVSCNAGSNGTITLSPAGGSGDYIVNWTGPNGFTSTDLSISDLTVGTYEYNFIDDDGMVYSTGSVDILEPSIIENSYTTVDASASTSDGSVDITVIGGTAPYTFLWSNGATTEDLTDVPGGTYSVVITDANGCTYNEDDIVVEMESSVNTIESLLNFDLFPIPADQYLNISLEFAQVENTIMKIYSIEGELLMVDKLDKTNLVQKTIDVSNLNSGVYILQIENESGLMPVKFSVIR